MATGLVLNAAMAGCDNANLEHTADAPHAPATGRPSQPPPQASPPQPLPVQPTPISIDEVVTDRLPPSGPGRGYPGIRALVRFHAPIGATVTLTGRIEKRGIIIASRPSASSSLTTNLSHVVTGGPNEASLQFSGEDILNSRQDGPYDVIITIVGPSNLHAERRTLTESYPAEEFSEYPAHILACKLGRALQHTEAVVQLRAEVSGTYTLRALLSRDHNTAAGTPWHGALTAGITEQVLIPFASDASSIPLDDSTRLALMLEDATLEPLYTQEFAASDILIPPP